MARKFKHKQTDWTAILDKFSPSLYKLYNRFDAKKGEIARDIIENSNDWVEITQEPVLVTEDGYQLNYRDKYYMVGESFKVEEKRLSEGTLFSNAAKRFYYRENIEAYIERHKPRYNIKDLMYLQQEVKNAFSWYWSEQKIEDAILKAIIDLKNSKND